MSRYQDLSIPFERISQAERPYVPVSAHETGRLIRWWFGFLVASCIFAGFLPNSDLAISKIVFHDGFQWEDSLGVAILQNTISTAAVLLFFAAVLGLILALYGRTLMQVTPRLWAFIASLYLIGPGIIVNAILTSYWGRAHPTDVTQFGGNAQFTPALRLSDQCAQNCSFVSIETALALSFAISLALLIRLLPEHLTRWRILKGIFWMSALSIVLPIVDGSHFLSDTLFAGLIISGLALILADRFGLRERMP